MKTIEKKVQSVEDNFLGLFRNEKKQKEMVSHSFNYRGKKYLKNQLGVWIGIVGAGTMFGVDSAQILGASLLSIPAVYSHARRRYDVQGGNEEE